MKANEIAERVSARYAGMEYSEFESLFSGDAHAIEEKILGCEVTTEFSRRDECIEVYVSVFGLGPGEEDESDRAVFILKKDEPLDSDIPDEHMVFSGAAGRMMDELGRNFRTYLRELSAKRAKGHKRTKISDADILAVREKALAKATLIALQKAKNGVQ